MAALSDPLPDTNSINNVNAPTPHHIPPLQHMGYLHKRMASILHHGAFHPRYCVLLENSFDYYPSQRNYCKLNISDNDKHRKRIPLKGATIISLSDDPKYAHRPFSFKIIEPEHDNDTTHPDSKGKQREYIWSADTKESYDSWFHAIKTVLNQANLNSALGITSETVTDPNTSGSAGANSIDPISKDPSSSYLKINPSETNESFEERQQFSKEKEFANAPTTNQAISETLPFPLPAKYLANDPYKQYINPQFSNLHNQTEQPKALVEFTSMQRGIDSIAENEAEEYSSDEEDQYSRTGSEKGNDHGIQASSPNDVQENPLTQNKEDTTESKYPSISPIGGYLHPSTYRPPTPHYSPIRVASGGNNSPGMPRSFTANDILITPAGLPVDVISPQFIETPPNTPATPFASSSVNARNPRGTSEPFRAPYEKLVVEMKKNE